MVNTYIVYVKVLIVYYIASVNLQYYSNKGNLLYRKIAFILCFVIFS